MDAAPLSALALGFVLGLQHATDADHLVAVATIMTRERRFANGALVGALWGAGHMTTLTIVGAIIIGLKLTVTTAVSAGLELAVAAMLIALGVLRLRDATRELDTVPAVHLVADHDHGRPAGVVHSHPHVHGGEHEHEHPHVHPAGWLAGLGWRRRGWPAARALVVGAVHGLAGSAAISLLVLTTLSSTASAVFYLVIFGIGTIIGMTLLTAVMAYPVSMALRYGRAQRAIALCAGVGSIAFGLFYGYRLIQ